MREIVFRGKDIAGNWHYGVPLVFSENYVCITAPHTYNKAVIPETVGQFTGLTDKNGKQIFEGDIIENEYSQGIFRKFDVRYDGVLGCWIATYKNTSPHFLYNLIGKIKIIGNIHDNPELLAAVADQKAD